MTTSTTHRRHAAKVAAAAAAIVVGCYLVGVIVLNQVVLHRLTAEADSRIAAQLVNAGQLTLGGHPAAGGAVGHPGGDIDDVPIFLWRVSRSGVAEPLTAGAPALPRQRWSNRPITTTVGASTFRLDAVRSGKGWLVAGQSAAEISRVRSVLFVPELVFGIVLALATFGGALLVGLRASAPLDLIRRRQAEFTADASHELRTPLTVVEAEVDLALRRTRSPEEYVAVLQRIAGEGRRLRRIVDDLLWLARADDGPAEPSGSDRADVATVVAECTDRFQAVAERQGVELTFKQGGDQPSPLQASPEWIDRLAGVLLDNACKYAGRGGRVVVTVHSSGGRIGLRVDDSGPGIPPEEQATVFDRFHRATSDSRGAGLGLAIADSVVRSTGGSWSIGRSPLGGARMEVSWRRAAERRGMPAGRDRKHAGRANGSGTAEGEDAARGPGSGPKGSVSATS
jgi:signal transduction histidine kinase